MIGTQLKNHSIDLNLDLAADLPPNPEIKIDPGDSLIGRHHDGRA